MSEQKTHAEIIAEMRKTKYGDEECQVKWCLTPWADRLDSAHKREIDELKKQVADLQQQLPKPDPNWRDICAKCFENGATEPPDCKYYTEDGCTSPIPDQHPLIQVGNAAKLREAVEFIKQYFDKIDPFNINTYTFSQIEVEHINEAIDAALAAPPRNCDVGTAEEQYSRMFRECYEWECMDCKQNKDLRKCALSWAQKPYVDKEGGAK